MNEFESDNDGCVVILVVFAAILLFCTGIAYAHEDELTDVEIVQWEATALEIAKCSGMLRGTAFLTETPKLKFNSDVLFVDAVKFLMVSGYTEYESTYLAKREQALYSSWIQNHTNEPSTLFLLTARYQYECESIEAMLRDLDDRR